MKRVFYLIVVLLIAFAACKKNEQGGRCTITGVVKHHEKIIGSATVYVKFNATEFPGADSSIYNTSFKTDGAGKFTFKCYKGEYYLYGTGIDDRTPPLYVSGGVPVKVRHKENVEVTLAVTENQ